MVIYFILNGACGEPHVISLNRVSLISKGVPKITTKDTKLNHKMCFVAFVNFLVTLVIKK
jgi:hypothetical protein